MSTMRAVIADELGPPENYHLREVPRPEPAAGQVQIQVEATGMGYFDALLARGEYQVKPPVPYCPGAEFSGTVSALGEGVQDVAVGDKVAASFFGGGLAEYAVVPASMAIPIPKSLDIRAAAGFMVNYITAWYGLLDRGQLRAGETLFVLGAAGGTGIAAVQVGRAAGAHVIAGASSEAKRKYAIEHGAHESLDYTQEDWRKTLKAMTDGRGVDVVFDPVGAELTEPAFRSLGWRGRHLVIGYAGGSIPKLPVNLALLKGASLIGVDSRQFSSIHEADAALAMRRQLFDAVERGDLTPPLGEVFAFEDYRDAMALAAARDGLGKPVVTLS